MTRRHRCRELGVQSTGGDPDPGDSAVFRDQAVGVYSSGVGAGGGRAEG